METILNKLNDTIQHLQALQDTFSTEANFPPEDHTDYEIYSENLSRLGNDLSSLHYDRQLYSTKGRQMILSDFIEYVFFGRIYYSLQREVEEREKFISAVLSFVNLLMCFETITVSDDLRTMFITNLGNRVPSVTQEPLYAELLNFRGKVGLVQAESTASQQLNSYFDTLLPKTAGGLWHELLAYIYLLRNDVGYIIPLLLSQRLIGLRDNIVPPDFLLLAHDKRLYGLEVGTGKEIKQSSNFMLRTAIPTATIDTLNSRTDRCPICKKWICFCPFVIENYSDVDYEITKSEVRCYSQCTKFTKEQIASGLCPYTKYYRNRIIAQHGQHQYANGKYHYHYQCVLNAVSPEMRDAIINAADETALMTHYPYYAGLEGLINY